MKTTMTDEELHRIAEYPRDPVWYVTVGRKVARMSLTYAEAVEVYCDWLDDLASRGKPLSAARLLVRIRMHPPA